ncbi:hypothetical protein H5410_007076 [Solanum commersonii]|uniref:Uncharacterized protein n=1 Tax=Solanum commersonii TaxID=4109 RepID=A0A9J6ACF5_SOLCO|nr:hypothetical protein H5410_007076 [Solanum commersonii]
MEMIELNRATASDMTKTTNPLNFSNIGIPLSSLLPPGTVKPAAKTIVAIKVATIIQEFAVSFIHLSPSFSNNLCSSVNNSLGVFPALFLIWWCEGGKSFSTS